MFTTVAVKVSAFYRNSNSNRGSSVITEVCMSKIEAVGKERIAPVIKVVVALVIVIVITAAAEEEVE